MYTAPNLPAAPPPNQIASYSPEISFTASYLLSVLFSLRCVCSFCKEPQADFEFEARFVPAPQEQITYKYSVVLDLGISEAFAPYCFRTLECVNIVTQRITSRSCTDY